MTPKEKAMKWIKEQEFAFYTYATLEKILDIALKEQAKIIFEELFENEKSPFKCDADLKHLTLDIGEFKKIKQKYT